MSRTKARRAGLGRETAVVCLLLLALAACARGVGGPTAFVPKAAKGLFATGW